MLHENSGAVAIGVCKDANPIRLPGEVITLGGHHLRYTVQLQMYSTPWSEVTSQITLRVRGTMGYAVCSASRKEPGGGLI